MDPEITTLRLRLLENGYDPIPLRGKRPDMAKNWHWQKIGHANPEQVDMWAKSFPDAINTGILARFTLCLDLDLLNPEAAQACEDYVREVFEEAGYVLIRIGRAPKRAIPFRTNQPFKKITLPLGHGGDKIELLADGQQFAAFGIHPDTQQPYSWHGGSPLEIKHEDLPYIDQERAQLLVDYLGELVRPYGYETKPKHDGGNSKTDWEPTDREELTRRILSGESLHDSVLKIAGSYAARGSPKQDCIDYIGLAFTAADTERYGGRWNECMKAIDYCYAKEAEKQPTQPTPSIWITGHALTSTPATAQEWSVRDLIPAKQVCLFSGHGAVGKSSTALHLAAAHVLGRAWLRFDAKFGPAFFIDAEDDLDVIHRRLEPILDHYEESSSALEDLHILSLAGKGAVMATSDRNGVVQPTALYHEIHQQAVAIKPMQIVIASSANVFAGSEMDRSQVTQFIDLLNRLAIATGGSVILISHPSLTGLNTNSGISGSTSWHNAVRARLYMKFITNGGDEQDASDLRVLEFQKNQYGPPAQSLTLRFRNGLFLTETTGVSNLDKLAREARADQKFRDMLQRMLDGNRPVSAKPTARNYAPTTFAREPDAEGLQRKDLEGAMRRLFMTETIVVKQYGKPSLGWERLEFV